MGLQGENAEEKAEIDTVDVEAIMERIRAQVKAAPRLGSRPKYLPPAAKLFDANVSPVLYSEELNYLNSHWNDWSQPAPFTSHRPLIGRLIIKWKTRFRDFLWGALFRDYFEREREFQAQLVRFLNASARYVDARDAALFWQIVKKVDNDISSVNERSDLLVQELSSELSKLGERIAGVEDISTFRNAAPSAAAGGAVQYLDSLADRSLDSFMVEGITLSGGGSFVRLVAVLSQKLKAGAKCALLVQGTGAESESTLAAIFSAHGFDVLKSEEVSGLQLETVPAAEHLPVRWQKALQTFNRNIDRLNALLPVRGEVRKFELRLAPTPEKRDAS